MRIVLLACAFALAALAGSAVAQGHYPSKPVRMIVPFGPGGASDFAARIIAPKLSELLGQPVVIENRAGAAGNIGMEAAANSPADGYTLYLGNVGTIAINPSVFAKALKIDPAKDFAPVSLIADTPDVLVVHSGFAARSVKEFVEQAKANPGTLAFASPGAGSMNRLEMELLRLLVGGLDIIHVPYKGGAGQAVGDVIGGQVPVMFTTLASAIGNIRGGKLRALGMTTRTRVPQLPEVPTLLEQGYDLVASSWQGVFVPAGTPRDIVSKLHAAVLKAMAAPEVAERFASGGVTVVISATPEAFGQFIAAEIARWSRVVKQSGATAD